MKYAVMVAAHKPYDMPKDALYLPMQVGAAGKADLGWQRDDEGENISEKNATFCELTGLYWLWKHVKADVYGLCHYRRYFAQERFGEKRARILSGEQAKRLMNGVDAVLPKKRHYWVETNYSQYIHAHNEADLVLTRRILEEKHGKQATEVWERVMARRSGHRFNMFLMRRDTFEAYCAWLFDILFELERRLDISAYSRSDRRVFGYVGERLMDVWLELTKPAVRECAVINLENQHWGKKITAFLLRKLRGGKPKNA